MRSDRDQQLMREDAWWDAFVHGERPPAGIDPALAETIVRVHALDDAAGPRPGFVAGLKRELASDGAATRSTMLDPTLKPVSANGYLRPVRLPSPLPGRRLTLAVPLVYAMAAALLVAIIGGVIGALFTDWLRSDDHSRDPAIFAPSTPVSTDSVVFEFTFPADAIPVGDNVSSGFAMFTAPAGTRSTWEPYCCPGPLVEHVLSGSYTVRADTPVQVIRANRRTLDVPAGTEVVLEPGDTLVARNETRFEAANTGLEPVTVLNWVLTDGDGIFGGHRLPGWLAGLADVKEPLDTRAEPTLVTIRMMTVQDGDSVPAPAEGLKFVLPVGDGTFASNWSDGSTTVYGELGKPVTVYILTADQAGSTTGTPGP